jgi:hypothetical protein
MNQAARAACCFTFALIGCASSTPQPPVPANLIPSGEREVDRFATRGVRSYECRAKQGEASSAAWVYTGAESDLLDAQGKTVGRHTFPPAVWEFSDGSKIAGGEVRARVDAPVANADPWILVSARSTGADGRFSKVTSLQRVNTVGGVAPAMKCDTGSLGSKQRVPFTADFVFFAK